MKRVTPTSPATELQNITWTAEVVEGHGKDLVVALARVTSTGYAIQYVMPNGVNRWTIGAVRGPGS